MTAYARRMFSDTVSYSDELSGGINNSVLSLTLKDGTTFPNGSSGNWTMTIDAGTALEEKLECGARSGGAVTIVQRGLGGTTPVAHGANAPCIHTLCGKDLDEANQAVVQTIGKVTTQGDMLYATAAALLARLAIGTANQVLSSSGTVPQWSTLLGLMETQFTANNQVLLGTGSGTAALTDILTALENKFTAAGQLLAGTGSATGELLAKGANNSVLSVGGADASGLQWQTILALMETAFGASGQVVVGTGAGTGELFSPFPVSATVAASQATSSTSYVDLATAGPAVTVTTGTSALVILTAGITVSVNADVAYMACAVSGASSIPAAAGSGVLTSRLNNGSQEMSAISSITGLTPGSNTFTAKYQVAGAATGTFDSRTITVFPIP